MGLGAFVRCRCFEEGKLKPAPVPADDLYLDEEGHVWSRTLNEADNRLDHKSYMEQYGDLEDSMYAWLDNCCEHYHMWYCHEHVTNSGGWGLLEEWLKGCSMHEDDVLKDLLPERGRPSFPTELAPKALQELDGFLEYAKAHAKEYCYLEDKNGRTLTGAEKGTEQRIEVFDEDVFFKDGILSVRKDGIDVFASSEVELTTEDSSVMPRCNTPAKTCCRITDLEGQAGTYTLHQSPGFMRVESGIYHVCWHNEYKWAEWKASILTKLLKASIETGNPILWC